MGPAEKLELWFHAGELLVMIFGMALPILWGAVKLRVILREFPPHRHDQNRIFYPKGMEPGRAEKLGA